MLESRPFHGEIYLHWNSVSEKGYVGQTTQGTDHRWKLHLRCARSAKTPAYRTLFSKAIRKYGADAFDHQVLATAQNQSELDGLERLWIWALQTKVPHGYNLTDGGDSGTAGHIVAPETRTRLSEMAKAQWQNSEYRHKHHAGMIATKRIGRKDSQETIEKRAAAIRGKKQSPEAIANRVAVLRGQKRSQAFCDACANRMRGRKLSAETRLKMSLAQKARQEKNYGA